MAELDEAIEVAAAELWHDANPGMPIRDCDAWQECVGIARRAVSKAAEVVVAATRRQIAERADRLATALADIAQLAHDINDTRLTPSTRADRALAIQADALRALREDRAAIARGRGETGGGQ